MEQQIHFFYVLNNNIIYSEASDKMGPVLLVGFLLGVQGYSDAALNNQTSRWTTEEKLKKKERFCFMCTCKEFHFWRSITPKMKMICFVNLSEFRKRNEMEFRKRSSSYHSDVGVLRNRKMILLDHSVWIRSSGTQKGEENGHMFPKRLEF